MADLSATNEDEDFLCIVSNHSDDTFEILDLKNNSNAKQENGQCGTGELLNPMNLFADLSANSILNKKSSNISLNVPSANGDSDGRVSSERSYSAESLINYIDDSYSNSSNLKCNKSSNNTSLHQRLDSPEKLPSNEINFDRLQQWIFCIAVVNFDIEIGQSIECIFPSDVQLTERESSNICYLSFPDSNSGCMGDTQFHFRTKTCPVKRPSFDRFYRDFNSNCLQILQVEQSYFYGYVYFRQIKDVRSKRGYFQKSIVILSWFPFVSLFSKILKILAPQYFEFALASLEAVCSDINRWPAPTTGQILSLPLLGSLTKCLIPDEKFNFASSCQGAHINLKKYSTSSLSLRSLSLLKLRRSSKCDREEDDDLSGVPNSPMASRHLVLNVSTDINIYRSLLPVIAHVQLLWELVLTCEPLAVITQSPNMCSDVVLSLIHCISPLKYGSDYRPFFTIHDSEFKEYTSHSRSPPPVILGVTNPFFVKTLAEWPHLIKISEISEDDHKTAKGVNMNSSLKKCSNTKSLDIQTGVYTKYKPFLQKDREILKKLLKGIESARPIEAQNSLLRRWYIELTQTFLIPLERYFASLMPLAKNLSPFKRPPILQVFKIEDFISTLDSTGPQLTTGIKGDWTGLYRRFLRSPNFVCWYSTRMQEATDKLRALHIEAICDSNLVNLVHDKPEVEIVDLILKLKENIHTATIGQTRLAASTIERLRANLHKIINVLPEDSRALFGRMPD